LGGVFLFQDNHSGDFLRIRLIGIFQKHPGRRISLLDYPLDGITVFLRLKLLVFFLLTPGMGAFIADPSLMNRLLPAVFSPGIVLFLHIFRRSVHISYLRLILCNPLCGMGHLSAVTGTVAIQV
jgi:hypothetical protein